MSTKGQYPDSDQDDATGALHCTSAGRPHRDQRRTDREKATGGKKTTTARTTQCQQLGHFVAEKVELDDIGAVIAESLGSRDEMGSRAMLKRR